MPRFVMAHPTLRYEPRPGSPSGPLSRSARRPRSLSFAAQVHLLASHLGYSSSRRPKGTPGGSLAHALHPGWHERAWGRTWSRSGPHQAIMPTLLERFASSHSLSFESRAGDPSHCDRALSPLWAEAEVPGTVVTPPSCCLAVQALGSGHAPLCPDRGRGPFVSQPGTVSHDDRCHGTYPPPSLVFVLPPTVVCPSPSPSPDPDRRQSVYVYGHGCLQRSGNPAMK